jgi:hypothetical protein
MSASNGGTPPPPIAPPVTAVPADDPHPELRVGGALAGGIVAALVLKGLARRKHRA